MSTHLHWLPNRMRLDAIVLGASIALLAPAFAFAAPQQSSTPSTPSQPAPPSTPGAGAATNRGLVNPTTRNQVATRPDVVVATRSITDARNAGSSADASVATTLDATAQQRLALQQLSSMGSRLDDLLATVSSSSGTPREQALATVVQELASQVSAMRQALLASGFSSFDRLADGQTIFLTPSNVGAEDRRQNGLDSTTTTAGRVPTITNLQAQPAVPASGMTAQAQSRRGNDPAEPVVAPD